MSYAARSKPPMNLDTADVERLLSLRHRDPHAILGAHPTAQGIAVRAYRPEAERVVLLPDGEVPIDMQRIDPRGLFEAHVSARREVFPYRLETRYRDGQTFTARDPYSFLPTMGELDLHLWGEGRHEKAYDRL